MMKKLSKDYIAGLIDGEGCFAIGIGKVNDTRKRKTKKRWSYHNGLRFAVKASFRIQMIQDGNNILNHVKYTLKVGKVYKIFISRTRKRCRDNHQYYIEGIPSLIKIIPYFDSLPLIVKRRDYIIWRKVVFLIRDKKHLDEKGFMRIVKLRGRMARSKFRQGHSEEFLSKNIRYADSDKGVVD